MGEVRLFSVVCRDRIRSNAVKTGHRKFHANMQKNFFTVTTVSSLWDTYQNRDGFTKPVCNVFKIVG